MIMMNTIVSVLAFANMNVRMRMRGITVSMRMLVNDQVFAIGPSAHPIRKFAHQARGRPGAKEYQHDRNREFHRESKAGRNRNFENYDRRTHDQHGERVAESPYDADSGRCHQTALAAQDGRDRDNVIGIGGMTHAEQQPEERNSEWRGIGRVHWNDYLGD